MKASNGVYVLLGFFTFMSFVFGIIFKKYTILLFHQSVYLCQGIINTLPTRLPENLGGTTILIFVTISLLIVAKIIVSWIKNLRTHMYFDISSVHNVTIEKLGNKLGLQKKILIYKNSSPLAFCMGFINPKIYLSTGLIKVLSKTELEAVLRHERYHLKNKDALVGLFATITQSLFPFFPIITDIAKYYKIQNEIAADKSVIIAMRSSEPLISVLRKIVAYEPLKPFALASFLSEWDSLEIRIKRMVNKEIENRVIPTGNILVSLISMFILGAIVLTPVRAVESHAKDKDFMVLCGPNQTCKSICEAQVIASFSHI